MLAFVQRYVVILVFVVIAIIALIVVKAVETNYALQQSGFNRQKTEQKLGNFIMTTKFSEKESFLLLLPQDVIDEAQGSWSSKLKTFFAGIFIAIATFFGLVLWRKRKNQNPLSNVTTAGSVFILLSFGSLSFTLADLAPIEPRPVHGNLTIQISTFGDKVELIRYVKKTVRKWTPPPERGDPNAFRQKDSARPKEQMNNKTSY